MIMYPKTQKHARSCMSIWHALVYVLKEPVFFSTWSSDSKKARIVPGIMPLIPPPSMLRTVIWFPRVGGWMGDLGVCMLAILKNKF